MTSEKRVLSHQVDTQRRFCFPRIPLEDDASLLPNPFLVVARVSRRTSERIDNSKARKRHPNLTLVARARLILSSWSISSSSLRRAGCEICGYRCFLQRCICCLTSSGTWRRLRGRKSFTSSWTGSETSMKPCYTPSALSLS